MKGKSRASKAASGNKPSCPAGDLTRHNPNMGEAEAEFAASGLYLAPDGVVVDGSGRPRPFVGALTCAEHPFQTFDTPDNRLLNVGMGRLLWEDEVTLLERAAGRPPTKSGLAAYLRLEYGVQDPKDLSLDEILALLRRTLQAESNASVDDTTPYSVAQLAKTYGVNADALRKRLERLRKRDHNCFVENDNRAGNEPQYLYRLGAALPLIQQMKAVDKASS